MGRQRHRCCLPGARRIGKPVKHGKPAVPFQRQNRFGAFRCSRRRRRVRNRRGALQRKRHCLNGIERLRICLARIHRKAIQRQRHFITQVDQGDGNWLYSFHCRRGRKTAFWQVCPNTSGESAAERSALKSARFGSGDVAVPYTSKRPSPHA